MCFARIVTHYWSNAAFLDGDQLLRDAHRLAGIPGVLITGRLDISGPPDIAWQLSCMARFGARARRRRRARRRPSVDDASDPRRNQSLLRPDMSRAGMRVLFAAPGAYGHVHPMIPLAAAMQRAGHTVQWATSPRLCQRLDAVGFTAVPAGIETEQRFAELHRRYPHEATLPPDERRKLMFPKLFGEIAAAAMLPELLAIATDFAARRRGSRRGRVRVAESSARASTCRT